MIENKPPIGPGGISPIATAAVVARAYFTEGSDPTSLKRAIRRWLLGIHWAIVVVPLLFYLKFGEVGPLGWGLTIFLVTYCILSAVGLYFLVRAEYHTPVAFQNDWLDKIGAFWLVACGLGPFFGWVLTSAFTLTLQNWTWLYLGRVGLCVAVPVLTALPLLRYVRGQGSPLMLAILLGVTALPIWSAWNTMQDLRSGPMRSWIMGPPGRVSEPMSLPRTERKLSGR